MILEHFNPFQALQPRDRKKFFPLSCLMFCLFFNYTLLRILKDALMITSPNSGAEVITFIKFWFGIPGAALMAWFLRWVSKNFSRQTYFYVITGPFFVFFILHAFVLVPFQSWLQPNEHFVNSLQKTYPHFQWIFPLFGNWIHVLFFLSAELWGSACFYYLFWQIANQSTTSGESIRFFSLFGLVGNFAMISAGRICSWISLSENNTLTSSLQKLILIWLAVLLLAYYIYHHLCQRVFSLDEGLSSDFIHEKPGLPSQKVPSQRLQIQKQLHYFLENPRLKALIIMVFAYGLTFNLIESLWKNQCKLTYPETHAYQNFMGQYFELTGWFSLVFMNLSSWFLRKKGWFWAALFTPAFLSFSGALFFFFIIGFVFFKWTFVTPIFISWLGLVINVILKASKFSFYDSSRELVYMTLSESEKSKGKGAIDLMGAPLGKASSSLVQQVFLIVSAGTQLTISPATLVLLFLGLLYWMKSVFRLKPTIERFEEDQKKEREVAFS